jgi:hypothetical protein
MRFLPMEGVSQNSSSETAFPVNATDKSIKISSTESSFFIGLEFFKRMILLMNLYYLRLNLKKDKKSKIRMSLERQFGSEFDEKSRQVF